jgi:hypothetical protein
MQLRISSTFSLLDGPVGVDDGFFDIETVQIYFAGFAVLGWKGRLGRQWVGGLRRRSLLYYFLSREDRK